MILRISYYLILAVSSIPTLTNLGRFASGNPVVKDGVANPISLLQPTLMLFDHSRYFQRTVVSIQNGEQTQVIYNRDFPPLLFVDRAIFNHLIQLSKKNWRQDQFVFFLCESQRWTRFKPQHVTIETQTFNAPKESIEFTCQ